MVLHNPYLLATGVVVLVLGYLLWRWAGRHRINLRSAALSSAFTAVRSGKAPALPAHLRMQVDRVAAADGNVRRATLVGGSVARHLLARMVALVGLALLATGMVLVAIAVLWT
jgi:hypothetical protein